MQQELEIEYKNLLTLDEYQTILDHEFSSASQTQTTQKIIQENYYFDTLDKQLKKQGAAVRIRKINSQYELTFKVPSADFLMETNINLSGNQAQNIIASKTFQLHEVTDQPLNLELTKVTLQTIFKYFNHFKTLRYEKKVDDNLLVLDQTTFQNKEIDYELEVEGQNPNAAKSYFDSILNKYSIPARTALPKIARAEKNK